MSTKEATAHEARAEAKGASQVYTPTGKELKSHPASSVTPDTKPSEGGTSHLGTPTIPTEHRTTDVARLTNGGGGELRSIERSLYAAGPKTFDSKYIPFAAGFSHMPDEAAVYRSTRLHAINPTAAVSDDVSYYYTLDSGRVPPAAMAANPETAEEFIRNTTTESQGGLFRRLMKPIR